MSAPEFGGCASCDGRCCRRYIVPLTCSDVHVISRALALAPEQFTMLVPEAGDEANGIRLSAGGPSFSMVLEKRDPASEQPPCVFLMELPDGTGRCGVYAHRPRVCRTFPAVLRHGGVSIRPDVVCPAGSWNLARMDLPSWRTELLRCEVEQALHRIVVARWNRTVDAGGKDREPVEFFRFAMELGDRLEALRGRRSADESLDGPARAALLDEAAAVVGAAGGPGRTS
jgi:Fe-S-cluster containining protein